MARDPTIVVVDAFASVSVRVNDRKDLRVGDLCVIDIAARLDEEAPLCGVGVEVVGRRKTASARDIGESESEFARLTIRKRAPHLAARAALIAMVRAFFVERRYLEVEMQCVVPSPGLDVHLDALQVDAPAGASCEANDANEGPVGYLMTSPEYQMKRLLVAGMPRIFQLARCFRRGELGAMHNPEFTMLEWYRAFATVDDVIEETEALVVHLLTSSVACGARGDGGGGDALTLNGRTFALTPPFERLPILRAFARHARVTEAHALALALSGREEDEEQFFRLLVDEVEPRLAEGPPVFLVDYPITQASLARKKQDDPRLAERFELFIGGVELCNGFGELVDPVEQRARFNHDQALRQKRGRPVYPIDERFLRALEEGMPPSAGNALGLDRLIALTLGADSIADVQTFPAGWL
ncbi:MAG: EF-P lysine aminoacylase EpmA [Polyangiales bacterium]